MIKALCAVFVSWFLLAAIPAHAQFGMDIAKNLETFKPEVTLGQWRQSLPERTVKQITVEVQRVKGNKDTFINARFGRRGKTLQGGRRVYLKNSEWQTVTFEVNEAPGGQDLILNAYNGDVRLRNVLIQY